MWFFLIVFGISTVISKYFRKSVSDFLTVSDPALLVYASVIIIWWCMSVIYSRNWNILVNGVMGNIVMHESKEDTNRFLPETYTWIKYTQQTHIHTRNTKWWIIFCQLFFFGLDWVWKPMVYHSTKLRYSNTTKAVYGI